MVVQREVYTVYCTHFATHIFSEAVSIFAIAQLLSRRKRVSKVTRNVTSNSGFVHSEKFHPYELSKFIHLFLLILFDIHSSLPFVPIAIRRLGMVNCVVFGSICQAVGFYLLLNRNNSQFPQVTLT